MKFHTEVECASGAVENTIGVFPCADRAVVCIGIHDVVVVECVVDVGLECAAHTFGDREIIACIEVELIAEGDFPWLGNLESLSGGNRDTTVV